jgi:hypothetical protein
MDAVWERRINVKRQKGNGDVEGQWVSLNF